MDRVASWLVNTCLLGLIPVLARLFVWKIADAGVDPWSVSDLVSFGLVIHCVSINDVSNSSRQDTTWKTVHNGLSILFIVMYGLLLFSTISVQQNLNQNALLRSTAILCAVSFALGFVAVIGAPANRRAYP